MTADGFRAAAEWLVAAEIAENARKARELRALADDLRKRGGGFTAAAERMARAKADALDGTNLKGDR